MKTKQEPRFTTDRPYKHNRATLAVIERIKDQPRFISMVSNVKDFQNKESK